MKFIFLLIFSVIFLAVGCEDDNDTIVFSGITMTNKYGEKLGTEDTTDWRLDDVLSKKELDLFSKSVKKSNIVVESILDSIIVVAPSHISACPNPVKDNVLSIKLPYGAIYDLRIVDNNFKILVSKDDLNSGSISFNLSSFEKNKIYRVYYRALINGNYRYGHGDVEVALP